MIPFEASQIEPFTPASLANVAVPPVFKLRPATGRERRDYLFQVRAAGLRFADTDAIRAETLEGLKGLWSPDDYEREAAKLQSHWALVDQGGTPDAETEAAVNELAQEVLEAYPPLAKTLARNARYFEESMRIAIAMFVVGWSGIDVPFRRAEGLVDLAAIELVEEKLMEIEKAAAADKVVGVGQPGTAFLELCNVCQRRLRLTEDEEKNSDSLPSSPPAPSGSKKKSSPRAASSSKASASSGSAKGGSARSRGSAGKSGSSLRGSAGSST